MLKIINFSKKFGDFYACKNINLEVKDGEIFGFVGPNGAGKTTTIKCIAGISDISEGEIIVNGNSVKTSGIKTKSDVAFIQDNPEIYEFMSGNEYINFIASIYKVPANELKEKTEKYARLFDLYEKLNNVISSYSHGMKQKLNIICALIHNPKLIIMDEPFVGLDPKASFILKELMKEFCKGGGTIFFSSHVLEVVQKLCDRIAIIKNGEIVKEGTVKQITNDTDLEQYFLEVTENA